MAKALWIGLLMTGGFLLVRGSPLCEKMGTDRTGLIHFDSRLNNGTNESMSCQWSLNTNTSQFVLSLKLIDLRTSGRNLSFVTPDGTVVKSDGGGSPSASNEQWCGLYVKKNDGNETTCGSSVEYPDICANSITNISQTWPPIITIKAQGNVSTVDTTAGQNDTGYPVTIVLYTFFMCPGNKVTPNKVSPNITMLSTTTQTSTTTPLSSTTAATTTTTGMTTTTTKNKATEPVTSAPTTLAVFLLAASLAFAVCFGLCSCTFVFLFTKSRYLKRSQNSNQNTTEAPIETTGNRSNQENSAPKVSTAKKRALTPLRSLKWNQNKKNRSDVTKATIEHSGNPLSADNKGKVVTGKSAIKPLRTNKVEYVNSGFLKKTFGIHGKPQNRNENTSQSNAKTGKKIALKPGGNVPGMSIYDDPDANHGYVQMASRPGPSSKPLQVDEAGYLVVNGSPAKPEYISFAQIKQ